MLYLTFLYAWTYHNTANLYCHADSSQITKLQKRVEPAWLDSTIGMYIFGSVYTRSPSRRHAQGSMQLCIRRNPNMAAHSIFSESLYGHAVLIQSCFSGFIISLFHKRRKGIAIFNIDSHVWISPYTLTSTELHAPSPARYAPVYT